MPVFHGIQVEGVRELTRALARARPEVVKQLAAENRTIGAKVVARLFPKPDSVGAGAGSRPRAGRSRNMVAFRSGGPHRGRVPVSQWGARYRPRSNPRPFVLGAALREFPNIERDYLDAVMRAVDAANAR